MSRWIFLRTFFVVASLAFLLPLVSFAQENQPQQGVYCPHLTRDLKFRDTDATTGGQVTELQRFLSDYYEDYPEWAITGNFRGTTLSFVKRFQREQNLPAFGYVGALTRAAIARVCGTTTPPPNDLSCVFNGQTVQNGHSITAYRQQFPGDEEACQSETRTCTNGQLSGSYQYATCSHLNPLNTSCTWNGQTVQHGASVTAYQSSSIPAGQQCISQTRTCTNGTLSGSYQYATCSVATTTCTPEAPQTQTLSCPTGQTGSITQTRTSTCPGPTWGAWTTTSNTCVTTNTSGATLTATPSSGAAPLNVSFTVTTASGCAPSTATIDYGDGSNSSYLTGLCQTVTPAEGPHRYQNPGTYTAKLILNGSTLATATITVTGGTTANGATLTATPSSGAAPLAPLFSATITSCTGGQPLTVDPGNGTTALPFTEGGISNGQCFYVFQKYTIENFPNIYSTPGTYTAKLLDQNHSVLATTVVTVTGPTASIQKQSLPVASATQAGQLANVFGAMEQLFEILFGIRR